MKSGKDGDSVTYFVLPPFFFRNSIKARFFITHVVPSEGFRYGSRESFAAEKPSLIMNGMVVSCKKSRMAIALIVG